MIEQGIRRFLRREPVLRRLLLVIGVITPVGILVVNASAFVMQNLGKFRILIAAFALISSLVLNGMAASWVLQFARRRAVQAYMAHPDAAVAIATIVVVASAVGAAYFTYLGMQDPRRLPDALAVITALLALLVPLTFAYGLRRLSQRR
jgi:hypothetical protein